MGTFIPSTETFIPDSPVLEQDDSENLSPKKKK